MIDIILDTDIGGDIDDALCLALALNSPEISLRAVTTVNTDPPLRARLAARMTHTFGQPEIPVAPGCKAMFDGAPTYCKDINHAVVLTLDDPIPTGDGVDLLIETARRHAGRIVIVGIGPWTNIATAFERAPDLRGCVARLVLMGGQLDPPGPESNIRCDPVAAAYVLNLPVPKLLVPLDVTSRQIYAAADHGDLLRRGLPETNLVRDFLRAFQLGRCQGDPSRAPVLHDPLALALAFDDSLITSRQDLRIDIEHRDGEAVTIAVDGDPNADVVRAVDEERFAELFRKRIAMLDEA
ncbi:MAG: nucleoside hydrolase [Gemmatimonadetes bacterium]|nr:nucleoside hydrolase [Gemmatimonadota bacterium]MBT5142109.1 nucleoside hydrolase [Gemmatimonadota bacterium]MBT6628552.1 nucleoside hydrolase [Gemmatimonadota bacterium]